MSAARAAADGESRPTTGRGSPFAESLPPGSVLEATAEQPGARAALAAALRSGPSHAYLFVGPSGAGKAAAARAFVAEILAAGSADESLGADVRRRALADPSPHPDLAWLRPPGNQHLVDDVRREVIAAVSYRPFEGERRAFVIESAEAMAEESQNALLKTLEEPPPYAHLILITSEPAAVLDTVRSRCQEVVFAPLPAAMVEQRLSAELPGAGPEQIRSLAALAGGDLGLARTLASPTGARIRELAERSSRAALSGRTSDRPWAELLAICAERGKLQASAVTEAAAERAEEYGGGRDAERIKREGADAAKRADRRGRTEGVDLGLGLVASWFADVVRVCEGAPELARNADRLEALAEDARGTDPIVAREVAELAMRTRRRLSVNVNEELALDALFHRATRLLGDRQPLL